MDCRPTEQTFIGARADYFCMNGTIKAQRTSIAPSCLSDLMTGATKMELFSRILPKCKKIRDDQKRGPKFESSSYRPFLPAVFEPLKL